MVPWFGAFAPRGAKSAPEDRHSISFAAKSVSGASEAIHSWRAAMPVGSGRHMVSPMATPMANEATDRVPAVVTERAPTSIQRRGQATHCRGDLGPGQSLSVVARRYAIDLRGLSSLRFGYQDGLHPGQRFSRYPNVSPGPISRCGCLT